MIEFDAFTCAFSFSFHRNLYDFEGETNSSSSTLLGCSYEWIYFSSFFRPIFRFHFAVVISCLCHEYQCAFIRRISDLLRGYPLPWCRFNILMQNFVSPKGRIKYGTWDKTFSQVLLLWVFMCCITEPKMRLVPQTFARLVCSVKTKCSSYVQNWHLWNETHEDRRANKLKIIDVVTPWVMQCLIRE